MIEATWQPGTPGHLTVTVPLDETAETERVHAVGRRVNLYEDDRPRGWIRVLELRRVGERDGEVKYLLAFVACEPPAPSVVQWAGKNRRCSVPAEENKAVVRRFFKDCWN